MAFLIKGPKDALNGKTDTKELEDNLKGLRDYIKNWFTSFPLSFFYFDFYSHFISNQAKTEEKFYEHQENFKNINKMIENFQNAFYSCYVFYLLK